MDKFLIEQWYENKHKLESYFRTTGQEEYNEYSIIVKKLFELVLLKDREDGKGFDMTRMTVIDDGDYQGTLIFIIPRYTSQPSVEDYIVTDTYYGSCSGCDLLLSINDCGEELPTEYQVSQYMNLALHLVQKMKWLGQ